MPTRCYFQDFPRFEHLEDFLRNQIQSVADHFIPSERYELSARIHTTRARGDQRQPKYLCEVRLDSPQLSSPVIIKKKDTSFHKAVVQVANVLRKVMRRQSRFRAQHHRREHQQIMRSLQRRIFKNEKTAA